MNCLKVWIVVLSNFVVLAVSGAPSARRAPTLSWREARALAVAQESFGPWRIDDFQTNQDLTPEEVAQPSEMVDVSAELSARVAEVFTFAQVEQIFQKIRDLQFLSDPAHPGVLRRSTWLYPDDGCYARAQLAVYNAFGESNLRVHKIFSFGDLEARTTNTFSGVVAWWYHVAPILRTQEGAFVLDPAIEPSRPLPVAEWLALQGDENRQIAIAICSAKSYDPLSACNAIVGISLQSAVEDQSYLLGSEWGRLEDLGRDPMQELGDFPPWRNQGSGPPAR